MKASRHSWPIVLVAAVIAGSALLMQHNGFFDGAFRTDILASIKTDEVLSAADMVAMSTGVTVDHEPTASRH
jgi:hypothetical protein